MDVCKLSFGVFVVVAVVVVFVAEHLGYYTRAANDITTFHHMTLRMRNRYACTIILFTGGVTLFAIPSNLLLHTAYLFWLGPKLGIHSSPTNQVTLVYENENTRSKKLLCEK